MNRPTLPRFVRLVVVATFSVFALTGATVRPIHPPTLGGGGPLLIAIVGDHYLSGQEDEFNYDVDNFIKRGLLIDSYYKDRKDDWRIVSYFEPTDVGKESRYGFKVGLGEGNCAVMDDQDPAKTTVQLLAAAVGTDTPQHTIVIGNHPYNFGCSKGDWTYVAVGAVGSDVLQHEFGHLIASLWDEWVPPMDMAAAPTNGTAASSPHYPSTWSPSDTRNCWPWGTGAPTPANWHNHVPAFSPRPVDKLGCDQVADGVIRPYDICRMGAAQVRRFCEVCKAEMDKSFAELVAEANAFAAAGGTADVTIPSTLNLRASHTPTESGFRIVNAAFELQPPAVVAQPVPQPVSKAITRPILKVVLRYNPDTRTVTFREMTDGSGQYVPNYRRTGQYMYEIMDGTERIDVGVIPDRVLEAHGSRGGAPHTTTKLAEVEIVVMVPGRTVASLDTRPLQVQFYKIPTWVTDRTITKASFPDLKAAKDKQGVFEEWGGTKLLPPATPKLIVK